MKYKIAVALMLMLALLVSAATAQETAPGPDAADNPLLDMLRFVPDNSDNRRAVSYISYRAVETARGIDQLTSSDILDNTDTGKIWLAASMGISSGLPLSYLTPMLQGMEDAVGFEFFAIDQSLYYGQPPAAGVLLRGEFDADQITAAYTARDYTVETLEDALLLCNANGCDDGQNINFEAINPANPFGGHLGRNEPIALIGDNLLSNSASDTVLTNSLEAGRGNAASLANAADYYAIAQAVTTDNTLLQINFFDSSLINSIDVIALISGSVDTDEFTVGANNLPFYTTLALADTFTEDEQIVLIALPYTSQETAEAAGAEVVNRLNTLTSLEYGEIYADMLAARNATIGEPYVYATEDASQFVAVIPISAPLPTNELNDEGTLDASGMVYRWAMSAVIMQDTLFLDPFLVE